MSRMQRMAAFLIGAGLAIYALSFSRDFSFDLMYAQYPDSTNLYYINGFKDPSLFLNDPIVSAFRKQFAMAERGNVSYSLYLALLKILPLPLVVKLISFLCFLGAVPLIYLTGKSLRGPDFGMLLSWIFLVYSLTMDSFYGGNGRAIGLLAFCAFIYCFFTGKKAGIFIATAPLFFFYPATIPMQLSVISIFFLAEGARTGFKKWDLPLLAGLIATAGLLAFFVITSPLLHSIFGHVRSFQMYKLTQRLDHRIDPRNPLDIILYYVFNLNEHSQLYIYATSLLVFFCLVFAARLKKRAFCFDKRLWVLLAGSALSFLLLYPFSPTAASRQFIFTMPFFVSFLLAENLRKMPPPFPAASAAFFVLFFVLWHPRANSIENFSPYRDLYERVRTLPKNVLIAGEPRSRLLMSIPFFAERSVDFTSMSKDLQIVSGCFDEKDFAKKELAVRAALSGGSRDALKKFIDGDAVDYLLLEDRMLPLFSADSNYRSLFSFAQKTGAACYAVERRGRVFLLPTKELAFFFKAA